MELAPLSLSTVVKSDGGFTYNLSNVAALRQSVNEEQAEWLVYVTDAGQTTHFQSVFTCVEKAGNINGVRVHHVGFGVVVAEDKKKFKTRTLGSDPHRQDSQGVGQAAGAGQHPEEVLF